MSQITFRTQPYKCTEQVLQKLAKEKPDYSPADIIIMAIKELEDNNYRLCPIGDILNDLQAKKPNPTNDSADWANGYNCAIRAAVSAIKQECDIYT